MIAIGDSLINGLTPDLAGVKGQSWARWLADAAGISYEQYAKGGLTSYQIVERLLPKVVGNYDYGVFNMGTNDVLTSWDPIAFRDNAATAATRMAEACERVIVLSVPISSEADSIVRKVAIGVGATVIDGRVQGRRFSRPDGIHPTALGYLQIADRAAVELGLPKPSLSAPEPTQLGLGYVVKHFGLSCYFQAKTMARRLPR
ncbi:hypothetical protein HTS88_20095 [Pseudarthrobacter oxydans]|uniref:SGNH/GDSL hydrolase family protein n=1 Tax=Pseudarthrobacter oxydans TaxID=1671 RepID=UPI0015733449|nr:SGNH/GDSL hydrolase family protein [Pseudarthrobacter oxydans]NSX38687.1 hypothetical protein [Pseudarthrobacter oxydans]